MMPISHEEMMAQNPPDDWEEYREGYALAGLEGDIVELFYKVRTHLGLSYAELGEKMGLSAEDTEDLEDFETIPTLEDLARLSRATGVPIHLVAGKDGDVADVDLGADRYPKD
jgi:ribosome-binding protein aMBF1 (putative translation factor)